MLKHAPPPGTMLEHALPPGTMLEHALPPGTMLAGAHPTPGTMLEHTPPPGTMLEYAPPPGTMLGFYWLDLVQVATAGVRSHVHHPCHVQMPAFPWSSSIRECLRLPPLPPQWFLRFDGN